MSAEEEVVDAELVEDGELLPAVRPAADPVPAARPLVDRHTVLYPGQLPARPGDGPTYSEQDFYVSEDTAARDRRKGAANTRYNRSSRVALFEQWCAAAGRVAVPCTTATYTEYGNHLIRQGLKATSISTYMSLIMSAQPPGRRPDPTLFREHLATYRRENPRGNRRKRATAIRLAGVMAMLGTCDERHPIGIRDAALLSCGYGVLARRIELADLEVEDVTVTDTEVIVFFPKSKTDQDAEGATVRIKDRPDLEPVRRMRAWLDLLRALGVRRGPLFRALTVAGTLQSRTVATARGDFLTGHAVNEIVKRRAKLAGIPGAEKATAHGLRAGPTTDMAAAGVRGKALNRRGRWADDSRIPETVYVRMAEDEEGDPLEKIPLYRPPTSEYGPDLR
ncbi:tyrosine-type recombinase/integrase [Streptomyces sp.]|uniref:tyrosine-type recombinase/integrase n=1 Tax=Streptomyces sp. TaxID=1931 RepID=UPI002F3F8568